MLYHGTSTKFGLEPGDTIFPPGEDGDAINSELEEMKELVFMAPKPIHARIYADRTARKAGGRPVLLGAIPSHPRQRVAVLPGSKVVAAPAAYVIKVIDL
jgi:hypothetical protein